MSGLIGFVAAPGAPVPDFGKPYALLRGHADEEVVEGSTGHARVAIAALPASRPQVFAADGVIVALFGRASRADAALPALAGHVDVKSLAGDFLRHGTAVLDTLQGAFALAIVVDRPGRREALIATDRLGIEPVCFAARGGTLAFGTRADVVAALAGIDALDPQALYDYLYFHMVPAPRTVYADVHRLLPGSFLHWKDGQTDPRGYWTPAFVEDRRAAVEELKPGFWHALQVGVAQAAGFGDRAAKGTVGCFLSGGTDSSTVAGVLGQVSGAPPRTFSIGFHARGYDEMDFARVAAQRFAAEHREYYVTPEDVANAVARIAAAHDQPFGNASVVPAYYCAKMAREHGVVRMLAGDGGDELYGGNSRYATQALFSMYGRVPAPLRRGLIEPLLAPLPAVGLLRKAKGYVRQANQPLPARLQSYNLLERLGAANVLAADFLAGIDQGEPLRLLEESYHGARAGSQINRLLALDLRFTLADSDLPKVNRACELAGVEVAYPLLDPAVVDFSLRLPPEYKLKGQRLRWFFKEALRDFLPREVIEKKKHGFGLPFGVWLRRHQALHELAGDTLIALRKRRIVNDSLLDGLLDSKLDEHAAYYGTLVWVLMTLEMWLARPAVTGGAAEPAPATLRPLERASP